MRHSASLTELGKRGDWTAVRKELIATQDDVEQAMTALRDQKLAHLISLGGWLRGLEIASSAVESKCSPERAATLWQRDLINYFAEEMKTLPPPLARTPLFEKLGVGRGRHSDPLEPCSAGQHEPRGSEGPPRPGPRVELSPSSPENKPSFRVLAATERESRVFKGDVLDQVDPQSGQA